MDYWLTKYDRPLKPFKSLEEFHAVFSQRVPLEMGPAYFEPVKILGVGGSGRVLKVRKKDTGELYALKVLKKADLSTPSRVQLVFNELNIMKTVEHPFIIEMYWAFQSVIYT